jgi:D-alanyl-D-alanine carboxypeptidase
MRAAPAQRPLVADAAPPTVAPKFVEAVAAPAPAPVATPAIAAPSPAPEPVVVAEASSPAPVAMLTAAAEEISEVSTAAAQKLSSVVHAFLPQATPVARPKARHAIAHRRPLGPTDSVVQLGSYRSPQYVAAAWSTLTKRYPALRAYLPLRARFDSANGTYWRLSIQGFGNQREAIARCQQLKSNGGKCFVRTAAGDAPVQIASN